MTRPRTLSGVTVRLAALAPLVAAFVIGCGDSSESSSPEPSTSTTDVQLCAEGYQPSCQDAGMTPAEARQKSGLTQESDSSEGDITLVRSGSWCSPTGVDDIYTGDGHVTFFLTFNNRGGSDASVDATPVRHYDDGEVNESALDMVTVDVPAGQLWRGHTPSYKYRAHEHDVVDCGVILDGGDEVPITVR